MMATLGKYTIQIDDDDAHLLSSEAGYSFQVQDRSTKNYTRKYVKARRNRNGRSKPYLHRLIMNAQKGEHIDHINGDGLDNRKANLRRATRSTNMANQRRPAGKSGYRGVVQSNGDCAKWTARVTVNGQNIYSCGHDSPEEAAKARDQMALGYFGAHAVLNFPANDHQQANDATALPTARSAA